MRKRVAQVGQKPTPASDANKRDSCRREGREEERMIERRKERDATVKKMNQREHMKKHTWSAHACREKTHNRDLTALMMLY